MVPSEPTKLTFHGPMEDSGFRHQGNGIQVDPPPKDDVIGHLVSLHFALHLDVEDLQVLAS